MFYKWTMYGRKPFHPRGTLIHLLFLRPLDPLLVSEGEKGASPSGKGRKDRHSLTSQCPQGLGLFKKIVRSSELKILF